MADNINQNYANADNQYYSSQLQLENQVTGYKEPVAQDSNIPNAVDIMQTPVIVFQEGNYTELDTYSALVESKVVALKQTIVPLIEAALIELAHSTAAFKRKSAEVIPTFDDTFRISATFVYFIDKFIGIDIPRDDIGGDAKYILNRISVYKEMTVTKCEINCTTGEVTIGIDL